MLQVVQASCPKCKNVLRIPADWLDQPMRCKHCREVFQARSKPEAAAAGVRHVPVAAPVASAAPPKISVPSASSPTPLPPTAVPARSPVAPVSNDPFSFASGSEPGAPVIARSRPRSRGWTKGVLLAVCVLAVAGGILFLARDQLGDLFHSDSKDKKDVALNQDKASKDKQPPPVSRDKRDKSGKDKTSKDKANKDKTTVAVNTDKKNPPDNDPPPFKDPKIKKNKGPKTIVPGAFPRRALLINVNNYLFANSLHYGSKREGKYPGSSTSALADQFNRPPFNIPATQIIELSDGARTPQPTLKPVIESTIADFLDTSRDQDRIVILFAGHGVEIEKEAYLVPLEGDLTDPKTLIPLQWVYDKMAKCPAWQKILILDVFRYPPARGYELPAPAEMGEVFDAKLQNPPAGVQVWSACVKGQ